MKIIYPEGSVVEVIYRNEWRLGTVIHVTEGLDLAEDVSHVVYYKVFIEAGLQVWAFKKESIRHYRDMHMIISEMSDT